MQPLVHKKLNFSAVIKHIQDFAASKKMLPIFACYVILSHMFGLETLSIVLFALYFVLVFVSKTHIRASIPPLLMLIFFVSLQHGPIIEDGQFESTYLIDRLWFMISLGVVVIAAAVCGIIKRKLKFRASWGFVGVLLMSVSLLIGGIMMHDYTIYNLVGGLAFAAIFILFYIFAGFIMKEVSFDYLAHAVVASTIVVLFQLMRVYYLRDIFSLLDVLPHGRLKHYITLGWGITNSIAPMIAVGMPFTVYLMTKHKNPIWMFILLIIQAVGIVLTFSRAMMIFAIPFTVLGIAYTVWRAEKRGRWQILIGSAVTFIVLIVFIQWRWEQIVEMLNTFGEDSGRSELYFDAWETFLQNPVFGAGVAFRYQNHDLTIMLYLVHNTVLQFMMWAGIVGLVTFLFHSVQVLATAFKRPSEKRLILLFAFGMIYAHSMLDVMFFFPHTTLFYIFFMAKMDSDAARDQGFSLVTQADKKVIRQTQTVYGNNMHLVEAEPVRICWWQKIL